MRFYRKRSCMLSLVISTIAYFAASYFIRRYLNEIDVPKSMTRSLLIFVAAAAISYLTALAVDWIV